MAPPRPNELAPVRTHALVEAWAGAGLRRHDVLVGQADRHTFNVIPAKVGTHAAFHTHDAVRIEGRFNLDRKGSNPFPQGGEERVGAQL
jgi:hypothetical protein